MRLTMKSPDMFILQDGKEGSPEELQCQMFVNQPVQQYRFMGQCIALKMLDFKEASQLHVNIRHAQYIDHLFANPFVIGDGVGAVRNEERLEKFTGGVPQPLHCLKMETARDIKINVFKVVDAVVAHSGQPCLAQRFVRKFLIHCCVGSRSTFHAVNAITICFNPLRIRKISKISSESAE